MELKPKKIAVICDYLLLPTRVGGMDAFFWAFEHTCKAQEIDVDWYFPNESRHGDYANFTLFSAEGKNMLRFFYEEAPIASYSLIFAHFTELCGPIFKNIYQVAQTPMYVVVHNAAPKVEVGLKQRFMNKLKGKLYSRYIAQYVVVSAAAKEELIKKWGTVIADKITLIPNGVWVHPNWKKTPQPATNRFITACHLHPDKGIQDLITAVSQLPLANLPPFHIDIYGDGMYKKTLEKMVEQQGLNAIFSFKGNVPQVMSLYKNYDYLIHPSVRESFCYTVIEALLLNVPVITTKEAGNVMGLVREGVHGWLFEAGNVAQLQSHLQQILTDHRRLLDSAETDKKLQGLTLDAMVRGYMKLVEKHLH
jgi:glycosyltransferase involved in cell wall biosynthesis